jgi:hypothetical protein
MLRQIKRGDGLLVWFDLFCLLFVGLLPAAAALLGRYPSEFVAITCFALDVALIQLASLSLWRHASRQGLINPALDPRVVVSIGRLNLSTAIFILSIPLALWNTWIIYLFWMGLFILLFTTDWLFWQQAARTQQTTFPLDDVGRASIHVQHVIGLLKIDAEAAGSILLNGVFGGGLMSHMDRYGDVASLQLSALERQGLSSLQYPWSWGSENVLGWTLHLTDQIPITLEIESSSGRSNLGLGVLQITDLKIRANTSEVQISLPNREGDTTVSIEAKTASFVILIPQDVAANIHGQKGTAIYEIDLARFPMIEEGVEYRSDRYKTASKRVDIRIDGSTAAVKIV